jgi:hypothetical protein
VKRPILFITEESNEDWWLQRGGKTLGPRPEMVSEMRQEADVLYYQYNVERFLFHSRNVLGTGIIDQAIQEAKELREQREKDRVRKVFPAKEIAQWYLTNPNADPAKSKLIREFRELMEKVFALYTKGKRPTTVEDKTDIEHYNRMRDVYYALLRSIEPDYEQHLRSQQDSKATTE